MWGIDYSNVAEILTHPFIFILHIESHCVDDQQIFSIRNKQMRGNEKVNATRSKLTSMVQEIITFF